MAAESSSPNDDLLAQMRKLVESHGARACEAALRQCSEKEEEDDDEKESLVVEKAMLDASFDPAFVTDALGTIQHTNTAALSVFGYKTETELMGKSISSIIGGPHAARHAEYLRGATTQERLDRVLDRMRDVTAKRADGTEFPVQVGIKVIHSEEDENDETKQKKKRFIAYCHDLSRHKKQMQQIQQEKEEMEKEERLMNSLVDCSFDAIILTDDCGLMVRVNQATLTEFGYSHERELVGRNVADLVGGGYGGDRHRQHMERFRERGGQARILGQTREVLARRKDGTEFPCRIGIKKVPHTELLVGYVRNITQEKEAMKLEVEKRAAEELLINMLPREIADRLKDDPQHIADHYEQATILFADIVGFTKMSNSLKPIAVVQFLNEIFSRFDERLDRYGLNKVKTIGDCYMVTSVPGCKDPPKSCAAVCHFAMDMITALDDYNRKNEENQLSMRVGINCGPVVAGVVGTKRFLYDIWGDAVNIASRMESTGIAGKIQITRGVVEALPDDDFVVEKRGSVAVKGIGEMETFFLKGRKQRRSSVYWAKVRTSVQSEKGLIERLQMSLRSYDADAEAK